MTEYIRFIMARYNDRLYHKKLFNSEVRQLKNAGEKLVLSGYSFTNLSDFK